MWRPDVNLVREDRSPPPPIPSPAPPHPPHSSLTQHTQPVLQDCQAEIPAKKLKRGHKKKISGQILADFTKNRQKRGRRKYSKEVPYF